VIGVDGAATARCSRADCTNDAEYNLNWRNPKIHTEDRVKVWLACAEHVDYLRDYLETRGLPVVVTAFGVTVDRVPDHSDR
jgi:hypothetical protein